MSEMLKIYDQIDLIESGVQRLGELVLRYWMDKKNKIEPNTFFFLKGELEIMLDRIRKIEEYEQEQVRPENELAAKLEDVFSVSHSDFLWMNELYVVR